MFKKLFALSGLKVALLITFIVCGAYLKDAFDPSGSFLSLMDKKWVDFIVKGRGTQPHSKDVVIAVIDSLSVDKFGRWPWPRTRIAQLVNALNDYYKARTIGFDIVFSEPEQADGIRVTGDYRRLFYDLGLNNVDSGRATRFVKYMDDTALRLDGDAQLGAALKKTPNSVLGYLFFMSEESEAHLTAAEREEQAKRIGGSEISLLINNIAEGRIPVGAVVEPNIEKVYQGGFLSGYFNMVPDPEDGTVRRVHLLYRYGDNIYPSLDLQILRHYYGMPPITAVANPDTGDVEEIRLGDKVVIQPNRDSSVMLNYKGVAQTFPHYSIYDIVEHKVPKEALADKIVLVGATEVGIFDLRTTPVQVNYPGVEVHATLLDNILSGTYFRFHDYLHIFSVLLILAVGVLLGVTLPHLKHIYGTILFLGLVIGYTFAHRWMVTELLSWTSFIYVVLVAFTVWGGVTLFRFLVSDRDQRFIKGAFKQYLSPEVIEQLTEHPEFLKLGGERRDMTAMFSDVQKFSSISEKLEPEELVKLLNLYLTDMSDTIMRFGGTVDKYEGDAIVAFFGAPVAYDDHAARAALVTLEMQKRLIENRDKWKAEFGTKWTDEHLPELLMRVGINSGPIVVGNMGSENHFNYTIMGNAVNLASRLEGANKNWGTYSCCSEMSWEGCKDVIEGRELDLIRVVGINKPVRVYEMIARKGELPDDQLKAYRIFEKGLSLYREQKWDEATKYFNAVMKVIPADPPSKIFIERCNEFKADPPGAEWDGVFVAESK
jgi:adenylate cyclase